MSNNNFETYIKLYFNITYGKFAVRHSIIKQTSPDLHIRIQNKNSQFKIISKTKSYLC